MLLVFMNGYCLFHKVIGRCIKPSFVFQLGFETQRLVWAMDRVDIKNFLLHVFDQLGCGVCLAQSFLGWIRTHGLNSSLHFVLGAYICVVSSALSFCRNTMDEIEGSKKERT